MKTTVLTMISVLSFAVSILGLFIPKDRAPEWEAKARDALLKFATAAQRHVVWILAALAAAFSKLYAVIADHLYLAKGLRPGANSILNQLRNDPTGAVSAIEQILWFPLLAVGLLVAYLIVLLLLAFVCRLMADYHKGAIAGVSALLGIITKAIDLFT